MQGSGTPDSGAVSTPSSPQHEAGTAEQGSHHPDTSPTPSGSSTGPESGSPQLSLTVPEERKLSPAPPAHGGDTPRLREEAARLSTVPFTLSVPVACKAALIESLKEGKLATPSRASQPSSTGDDRAVPELVPLDFVMRPILPTDAKQLQRGMASLLSRQSLFMRFLRPVDGLSSVELRYLVDLDLFDRFAWGISVVDADVRAAAGAEEEGVGVGVARYVRVEDPGKGEFRIVTSGPGTAKAALQGALSAMRQAAPGTPRLTASLKGRTHDHPAYSAAHSPAAQAAAGEGGGSGSGAASSTAEMAITVADPLHQCGLGTLLMWALSQVALRHGITHFVGVAHEGNAKIKGLMASLGSSPQDPSPAPTPPDGAVRDTYVVSGMKYFVTPLPITLPPTCKALRRMHPDSKRRLLLALALAQHVPSTQTEAKPEGEEERGGALAAEGGRGAAGRRRKPRFASTAVAVVNIPSSAGH